jgi:hypothetical protein
MSELLHRSWDATKAAPFRAHGPYSGERALLLTVAAAGALVSVVMSGWFITWGQRAPAARRWASRAQGSLFLSGRLSSLFGFYGGEGLLMENETLAQSTTHRYGPASLVSALVSVFATEFAAWIFAIPYVLLTVIYVLPALAVVDLVVYATLAKRPGAAGQI